MADAPVINATLPFASSGAVSDRVMRDCCRFAQRTGVD
jgi:hypothetical protein